MRTTRLSNRTITETKRYITLRSYEAYVAQIDCDKGTLTLGPLWDYSTTTWQHVRKFIALYSCILRPDIHLAMERLLKSKNGRKMMQLYIDEDYIKVTRDISLTD